MAALPIHLRAKRGTQTIFVVANPGDTVRLIKSRLSQINRITPDRIKIFAADQEKSYEDESTVADHLLKDNDIIYFVHKADGAADFEPIKVVPYGDGEGEEKK